MSTSILDDIKKVLGVHAEVDAFDTDIIMHINTAFFQLNQLGVGPSQTFSIQDSVTVWEEFFEGRGDLNAVKSYIMIVVRLLFDRPETSYGIQALERQRDEFAWRLEIQRLETIEGTDGIIY